MRSDTSHRQRRGRRVRGDQAALAPDPGRGARLETLIREEVNFLLRSEIADPRLEDVTITMAEVTPDGACARLWFVQQRHDPDLPATADAEILRAFERAAGFLRSRIGDGLALKRTPELRFRKDRMLLTSNDPL